MDEFGGGLRQRAVNPDSPSSGGPTVDLSTIRTAIRSIDAFPKMEDDQVIKTGEGGLSSIIAIVLMLILFVSETHRYIAPGMIERLSVDVSDAAAERAGMADASRLGFHSESNDQFHWLRRNLLFGSPDPLTVFMDVTVLGSRCEFVETHTVDQADRMEHDFSHRVAKLSIDADSGHILNPEAVNGDRYYRYPHEKFYEYCGSCRGDEMRSAFETGPCCNTCLDVRSNNPAMVKTAAQCKREIIRRDPNSRQNCRIIGSMPIEKLSGNFHIGAPNTTHFVNQIIFGMPHPSEDAGGVGKSDVIHKMITKAAIEQTGNDGKKGTPALSGHYENVPEGHSGVFRYHLKLVPFYSHEFPGRRMFKYSTALNRNIKKAAQTNAGLFVGRRSTIFFVYDFSPYVMVSEYASKGFLHYLTDLCAIVGGAFAIAKLIDATAFLIRGPGIKSVLM